MRRRRRKRRAGRRTADRAGMVAITLVVLLLFVVLALKGCSLRERIAENDSRQTELELLIEAEEERTANIESRRDYIESEEFIKQAAREYFGLVESGDILFRRKE